MTVATLGLAVDSSQVKSATAALERLNAASSSAAKGADRLAVSGQKSETVMRAIAASAKRMGVSTEEMEKRFDAAAAAQNKMNVASQAAVKRMTDLSSAVVKGANDNTAYSKSATKVIENLALEELRLKSTAREWAVISALRKAGVDVNSAAGKEIAEMAGRVHDLDQATGKATTALDKFANRFVRGFIVGATIQTVRAFIDNLIQLNSYLAATADTAQRVGIGGQQFQGLQSAASYKGIGNADFNAAMLAFGKNVDEARHGLGDLQSLLALNGKTVKDTAGTFGIVADMVRNAASESQKFNILQAAGLPATQAFVRLMEQGADAITRQSLAAAKLQDKQLEDAKRLEDRWNEMWTNFANWGKGAILDVGEHIKNMPTPFAHQGTWLGRQLQNLGFDRPEDPNSPRNQGLDMLRRGMGSQLGKNGANSIYNATGGFGNVATPDPTKDLLVARQQIALEQQRLGLLSPLATAQDVVRAKQLEINAAALNNVTISKQQADALKLVTLAQFEMNRVNQQAQIGVFNLDAANKAAQDTLKAWVAQKLLDPTNAEQMAAAQAVLAKNTRDLADAASVAGSNLPNLQRALNDASDVNKQLDQFATSSFSTLTTGLTDIFDGTKTAAQGFSDLGKTVLRSLEEMLVKMYIVLPIFNALKGALGGGGLLGSILPGIGGGVTASAMGNVFPANDNGISRYSNQIVSRPTVFAFAKGIGLMGEAGDEAIMPLRRGPDGTLGVMARGGGSAQVKNEINIVGGGINPNDVQVQQTEDGRGNVRTDIVLDQAVANALSRSGSQTRRAMGNNYGARPIGVRR